MNTQPLRQKIKASNSLDWEAWLSETLHVFACTTGTLHVLEPSSNILHLKAYTGIPDFLLPKMTEIPVGKGMAGIAAERREAVQVCNLQTDASGVVRPGAKDTKVEGAITVPLLKKDELYGTLGIAKKEPYEFTDEETNDLMQIAETMAEKISGQING
ncbi:GAF domain-containing protein [Negadavirga shengliensis]|uniref:GAF domain-containing protein n=1 Tax=Negadavirga shengliensis TaxID=1389218 RepID=A0ABV9SYV9_9BACT